MIGPAEIEETLAERAEALAASGGDAPPRTAAWPVAGDAPPGPAAASDPPPTWFWNPFAPPPNRAG